MYSYEDRLRAVQLYIKLGKRVGVTIRQLGYPTKNALKSWYRAFERCAEVPAGYARQPRYTQAQQDVAIEHMTCVLGQYALDNKKWDEVGADPVLLDLLRWHRAEEIEHRSVAFDLYRHLGGTYPSRYYLSLIAMPAIFGLWAHGAAHLMKQDPRFADKRPSVFRPWVWLEWQRQSKTGMLPSLPALLLKQLPFFSPWYDPVKEGSTEDALAYLEGSPAAAAARSAA